jgi:hypothetical protein
VLTPLVVMLAHPALPMPHKRRQDDLPNVGSVFANLRRSITAVNAMARQRLDHSSDLPTSAPHWEEMVDITGRIEQILTPEFQTDTDVANFIMQQFRLTATTTDASIATNQISSSELLR